MTKHNMDRYKNGGAKTKEKYDKIRIALESWNIQYGISKGIAYIKGLKKL
jgi:hypothetical protein